MALHLAGLQGELDFELQIVDIDSSPELFEKYQLLIPVLVGADVEICHHFLDEAALRRYLLKA